MTALREATARAPPVPFRVLVVQAEQRSRVPVPLPRDLESHDIRHVYIKPTTPHLNGKVDRSDRVDQQAFNELLDKDGIADDIHLFNDSFVNGRTIRLAQPGLNLRRYVVVPQAEKANARAMVLSSPL
jgi:hypothetical protein